MVYHAKTRTMDAYVTASLQAFSALHLASDIRALYQASFSGPLLHHIYLDSFCRSIHSYLTPGQILDTTRGVIRQLTVLLDDWLCSQTNDLTERPRKKRKLVDSSGSADLIALKFSLVARIGVLALAALPLQLLLPEDQDEVQREIHGIFQVFELNLKNALQIVEKTVDSWGWQLLITTVLRSRYNLATSSHWQVASGIEARTTSKMRSCLKAAHSTAELRVEIVRRFIYCWIKFLIYIIAPFAPV